MNASSKRQLFNDCGLKIHLYDICYFPGLNKARLPFLSLAKIFIMPSKILLMGWFRALRSPHHFQKKIAYIPNRHSQKHYLKRIACRRQFFWVEGVTPCIPKLFVVNFVDWWNEKQTHYSSAYLFSSTVSQLWLDEWSMPLKFKRSFFSMLSL